MRNLQNKIEDKLINFYQNLSERDQIKVIFSLPQLQNCSFFQAVNRSAEQLDELSVSQGMRGNFSVEDNISLVQNSPNNFSHIRTSSPKNEGCDIPKFKPQIDKDVQNQREKEPVMNNLLGGNKPGNSNGLSSKIKAKFNIFLKRKTELEVEVKELLGSSNDEQVQPTTLKLRALDLKSRLTF